MVLLHTKEKRTGKFYLIITLFILFTSMHTVAQADRKIPKNVLDTFHIQYPDVILKNYTNKKGQYLISFISNHNKRTAYYNSQGTWLMTITKFTHIRQLPLNIQTSIKKYSYSYWYFERIEQYNEPTQIVYRLKVNNSNLLDGDHASFLKKYVLDFTENGALVAQKEIQ
jgi:hypothetical protein